MFSPNVYSFFEFGRGELLLHTRGTAMYDSNVFALEDPEDDILFLLNPELEFIRRAGRADLSVRAGVNIGRFVDFSEEDFENYYAAVALGYPVAAASPLSGGIEVSYTQSSDIDDFLNERTETETFSGRITNRYRLNQRVGLRNSFQYSRIDRQRVEFSRVDRISGTLGLAYFYSENLDFYTSYRIRRSRTSGRTDIGTRETIDHAISIGANGDLSERLSGDVSVGVQNRQVVRGGGSARNRIIFSTGLAWAARPNTTLTLDGSRDLDLSPEDRTVERTTVRAGLTQRLTPRTSGNVFTGVRFSEFGGVETDRDTTYTAGAGLTYLFTNRWNADLEYTYNHTDSERRNVKFERHTVALSTSYTF